MANTLHVRSEMNDLLKNNYTTIVLQEYWYCCMQGCRKAFFIGHTVILSRIPLVCPMMLHPNDSRSILIANSKVRFIDSNHYHHSLCIAGRVIHSLCYKRLKVIYLNIFRDFFIMPNCLGNTSHT